MISRIAAADRITSRIAPASRVTSFISVAPFEFAGLRQIAATVNVSAGVWATLSLPTAAGLAASVSIVPAVTGALTVRRELAASVAVAPSVVAAMKNARQLAASGVAVAPAVVATVRNARALATDIVVTPAVVAALRNPRALAASPSLAPAVAAVLKNPRLLAAALAANPGVTAALWNTRELAAAVGVSPSVAATLTKAGAAFLPTSITGCIAWFDMADAASYTNAGGFITSITNKVSSVAWTEGTAPPAYLATGLNSLPTMDFNGTTQKIISTEAAVVNALKDSLAHTVFIVMQPDSADRTEAVFAVGAAAVQSNRVKLWGKSNVGAGKYQMNALNDAATTFAPLSTGIPTIVAQVAEYRASTTQAWIQINGAVADPAATGFACGTLTADRAGIGMRPDLTPDLFYDGKISEIIVYDNEVSTPDRSTVRQYLGTKWTVTVTP